MRFYAATAGWLAGLVALCLSYHIITGLPPRGSGNAWGFAYPLAGWIGLLLPHVSFAGGLAVHASWSPRSVTLRALLVSIVSYGLLAFGAPMADFQMRASAAAGLSVEFPYGPRTPGVLKALRSDVEAKPPASYSFSIDRPLEQPPNWITYRIHSPGAIAWFAVLAALLGHLVGFLTSGLSPPARKNARWALGFLSAAGFFLAEAAGGEWVRLDPSNSGLMGAWLPLLVPLLELVILGALSRRLRKRAYDPAPLSPE